MEARVTTVRLTESDRASIAETKEILERKGIPMNTSQVIRLAIRRGLALVTTEMGGLSDAGSTNV